MSDTPALEIDADNPLLVPFAIQHDFRERFVEALEKIVALSDRDDLDLNERYSLIVATAKEAIDDEAVRIWFEAGRPLPVLDELLGDVPAEFTTRVLDAIDSGLRGLT